MPTIVTSRPSRIQTAPSPTTTSQCQRAQGSRSMRAGMFVSMVRSSTGPDAMATSCQLTHRRTPAVHETGANGSGSRRRAVASRPARSHRFAAWRRRTLALLALAGARRRWRRRARPGRQRPVRRCRSRRSAPARCSVSPRRPAADATAACTIRFTPPRGAVFGFFSVRVRRPRGGPPHRRPARRERRPSQLAARQLARARSTGETLGGQRVAPCTHLPLSATRRRRPRRRTPAAAPERRRRGLSRQASASARVGGGAPGSGGAARRACARRRARARGGASRAGTGGHGGLGASSASKRSSASSTAAKTSACGPSSPTAHASRASTSGSVAVGLAGEPPEGRAEVDHDALEQQVERRGGLARRRTEVRGRRPVEHARQRPARDAAHLLGDQARLERAAQRHHGARDRAPVRRVARPQHARRRGEREQRDEVDVGFHHAVSMSTFGCSGSTRHSQARSEIAAWARISVAPG